MGKLAVLIILSLYFLMSLRSRKGDFVGFQFRWPEELIKICLAS